MGIKVFMSAYVYWMFVFQVELKSIDDNSLTQNLSFYLEKLFLKKLTK